jgi:geranylgeranyl pyrophosphate synthase
MGRKLRVTLASVPPTADVDPRRGPADGALADVERLIAEAVQRLPGNLAAACERVAAAGGRRLRARLVLTAAAAAGGGDALASGPVVAAAAIELVHLASLVHDDLIDDAPTRRGAPTINAAEGPTAALLAGNCLQAAAMGCAAQVGAAAVEVLQQTIVDLCAGAAREQDNRYRVDVDTAGVLEVAELKAGALLAAACRMGALATGAAGDAAVRVLAEYGRLLGIALQLVDDLLDVTSTAELLGKPVETDFANGIVTLPALPALAADARLRSLLRPDLSPHERRYIVTCIRQNKGVSRTYRAAVRHVHRASVLANAPAVPPGSAARALAALPSSFLDAQLRLVHPAHRPLLAPAG